MRLRRFLLRLSRPPPSIGDLRAAQRKALMELKRDNHMLGNASQQGPNRKFAPASKALNVPSLHVDEESGVP